jgi:hypothetical protein
MTSQAVFSSSLLTAGSPCPPGLTTWNNSDPGRRFDVYRNNVLVSLIDAMADSCPVVEALVGTEFFRAMAGVFVRAQPPASPVMAHYGAGFDTFIRSFPPAAALPYLADMARLELMRAQAFHAADANPLGSADLAHIYADSEALPAARIMLHPSVAVMSSSFAIASLWHAHQADDVSAALSAIDTMLPESVLISRVGLELAMFQVDAATANFITALGAGMALAEAVATTQATSPDLDLPAALSLLLRSEAMTAIHLSRNPSDA